MEELVARTRRRLLNAVRHLPDAEDAVQAAYLALLQARPPGSVAGWLYTTTVRIAYRRKARLRREEQIAKQLGLASAAPPDGDIDADLVRNEVARLPAKYRDPVILHHLNGLATAEVARLLEVEPATVRTRLHRGRALLRHRLGPRLAYGVLALPWLFRDAGGALAGGALMSRKVGAIVVLVLLLLAGGVWRLSATSGARSPRTDAAAVGQARVQPAPEPVVETSRAAAPAPRAEPELTGIVVDRAGGPIAGVAVIECEHDQGFFQRMRWFEPQEPGRTLARTDADGRFDLKSLQGAKSLIFLKAGYAPAIHDVAPALRVVLALAQTIVAIVRDRSGRVISGACVTASGAGLNQRVFTDDEGRVTFDTVPLDERIRLSANGLGYFPDMPAGVAPEMEFTLKRMGLLIDVVDAETGTPVEEARAVFSKHAEPPQLNVPVDPGLLPRFFREQPGHIYCPLYPETKQDGVVVDVHVFAPGYRPHEERLSWKRDEEPPRLLVRLERGSGRPSLRGRVTTAARLEIRMRWRGQFDDMQEHLLVTTIDSDAEGNFEFAGLPAGAYRLVALAPGYGPAGIDVDVPDHDVRVELKRAATLDLQARDAGGNALANYWFHVETKDRRRWWEAETGADGRATLDGLTPGDLAVFPLRTQGGIVLESYPGPRVDLALKPGERRSLAMTAPVPRTVTVHLRDDGGNALPGMKVSATAWGGYAVHRGHQYRGDMARVTDESGTIRLDLWPGIYEFAVRVGTAHVRDQFTVAADGPDRFELVATLGGAVLRGKVVDSETGEPLAGARLDAWSRGNTQATGRVDDSGDFVLRGVPQGLVRLVVYRQGTYEYIGKAWREIEMPARGTKTVDFHLPKIHGDGARTVPFSVVVRDAADSQALQAVSVQLRGRHRGAWIALGSYYTDARGRVEGTVADVGETVVIVGGGTIGYDNLELTPDSLAAMEANLTRK